MEKTFVCVKPDGVQRGLIGEVVKRFENRGFVLCAAKFMQVTPELAAKHYAEHEGKPFYNGRPSVPQSRSKQPPAPSAMISLRKWTATSSTLPTPLRQRNGKSPFGSNRKRSLIMKNPEPNGFSERIHKSSITE